MSLILDALNRSRQDENPVPGLATHHPVEPLTAQRRQYYLWAALAVAALVIAGLVVDRLRTPPAPEAEIGAPVAELSRNIGSAVNSVTAELEARAAAAEQAQQASMAPEAAAPQAAAMPEPAAVQPAAAPTEPTVQPTAAPPEPTVQPTAAPPVPAAQQAVAPLETVPQSPAPVLSAATGTAVEPTTDAPGAAPSPEAAPPSAERNAAVEQLYQNRDLDDAPAKRAPSTPARPQRVAQDVSDAEPADVDRILKEARDEMENASLDEHPVPFLADLSQQTKDAIPTLYYQRHEYSSNASQSSVTLNGNTVKAGGSVIPGMKVEEILPDSVVLNYQGTQFRLRALNSWINL